MSRGVEIGVDCETVSRWRAMLADLETGASRTLFSEREHKECRRDPDPAARYAERWCVKEAVFKALPSSALDLRRIEALGAGGRLRIRLGGRGAARFRGWVLKTSVVSTRRTALAFVVARPPIL